MNNGIQSNDTAISASIDRNNTHTKAGMWEQNIHRLPQIFKSMHNQARTERVKGTREGKREIERQTHKHTETGEINRQRQRWRDKRDRQRGSRQRDRHTETETERVRNGICGKRMDFIFVPD